MKRNTERLEHEVTQEVDRDEQLPPVGCRHSMDASAERRYNEFLANRHESRGLLWRGWRWTNERE